MLLKGIYSMVKRVLFDLIFLRFWFVFSFLTTSRRLALNMQIPWKILLNRLA